MFQSLLRIACECFDSGQIVLDIAAGPAKRGDHYSDVYKVQKDETGCYQCQNARLVGDAEQVTKSIYLFFNRPKMKKKIARLKIIEKNWIPSTNSD